LLKEHVLNARSLRWVYAAAIAALTLASPAHAYSPQVLRVGFAPFENAEDVVRKAQPVVAMLRKTLGMEVRPYVAGDYPGVVEAMKGGKLDVAFYSPAAFVMAEKIAGARLILKSVYKGRSVYYSAIITRNDSKIKTLADLKGKTFAFVDPGSTSGGVYPKVMLMNAGINPAKHFSRVIYAGGHDAAILAVVNHKVDAAATFANDTRGEDVPWKPMLKGRAGEVRVIGYSKPIPNGAIAVAKNLDPALTARVRQAFLDLGKTAEGRKLLAQMYLIDRFEPAAPHDYDSVREAFQKVGLSVK
jgi:phosphonate transport system substrate-binding protein